MVDDDCSAIHLIHSCVELAASRGHADWVKVGKCIKKCEDTNYVIWKIVLCLSEHVCVHLNIRYVPMKTILSYEKYSLVYFRILG